MTSPDHSKLISASAKSVLAPIGCFQKGRSRIWIDDHQWWIAVIEFQPSSWSKGSYLNVGACWLWNEKDYLSFDYGSRVQPFQEFDNIDQFTDIAKSLAETAKEEVLKLRCLFPTIDQASKHLKNKQSEDPWSIFHAAISSALLGNIKYATSQFEHLQQTKSEFLWESKLKARAADLQLLLENPTAFHGEIISTIIRTRALLKLPSLKQANPFAP